MRFLIRQRKSTKFFFPKKAKKFRNFEFLSRFGQDPDPDQDPDPGFGSGSAFGFGSDPDPDP